MATKNNIRSIRFSDELAELIERQQGENFTQKFENLVYRCAWELPAKERELKQLEERIHEKREQLRQMSAQARELSETLRELLPRADALEAAVDRAVKKWDVTPSRPAAEADQRRSG